MLSCAFQIGVVFSVVFLIFVTLLPFLFVYPLLCCNFYFPLLFGFYFLHTLLFLVQLIFYNAQFIFCWFCFVLCFHFLSLILRFYFLMTCMLYIFVHFLAINFLLKLGVFILFTGEKPWSAVRMALSRLERIVSIDCGLWL